MQLSLPKDELLKFILRQVDIFYPDGHAVTAADLNKDLDMAIQRAEYCFSKVNNRYFSADGQTFFNHLNGDQYGMFLYFFCNTIFRNSGDIKLATKLFALNKALHGVDAFYEVMLPDIFLWVHPLSTVLGRGKYSDYFLVYQRCNIGANKDIYPTMDEHVSLHPGGSILGTCHIGKGAKISTGSLIMDMDLPEGALYIGDPRGYVVKKSSGFNPIWKIA